MGVVGLALVVEGVPDREGDAEEALPRDQPVAVEAADPVVVAVLHVGGQPGDLGAALEHLGADARVAAAVADVPLAGGDDLERLVALLVEVRHPLGRRRLAVEVAGLAEQGDHRLAGREGRLARQIARTPPTAVSEVSQSGVSPVSRPSRPTTVRTGSCSSRHHCDVGQVAEGAAHGDAGALVDLGGRVGDHRDLDAEDRRGDGGAEQRLVALVVGVRDQRDGRRGSARDGSSRCTAVRRQWRGRRPGGRRRGTRGPRARPARPRSGR